MATIERIVASGRVRFPLLIGIAVAAGLGISAGAWSAGSGQAQAKAPAPARGVLLAAASNTEWCGDNYCDTNNESCSSCPQDCGECCGNGVCDNYENGDSCPQDCQYCGNGVCDGNENPENCELDCGPPPPPPPYCGDKECQRDHESCNSCPQDCGGCENDGRCFPNKRECEDVCRGVCERRIECGGATGHKCFE